MDPIALAIVAFAVLAAGRLAWRLLVAPLLDHLDDLRDQREYAERSWPDVREASLREADRREPRRRWRRW